MGGLTSNRKRSGEDIFSLSYFTSPFPSQVLKKPKFSPMHIISFEKPSCSTSSALSVYSQLLQSTFDRVQSYPEPKKGIRREVHGPCRNNKVLSSMGNALIRKYDEAKQLAYETFQYPRKDKAVINVDDESPREEVEILDEDEDVVVLDHGRDRGQSVGLNSRSAEINEIVYFKERYETFAENRVQGSSSVVSDLSNQTVKVEDDSLKEFGALWLNREALKVVDELPHKKLYKSAEKRNSRLSRLAFSIEICKKKLELFFPRIAKKPDEGFRREPFVPLTEEEEAEVSLALSNSNRRNLLVSHDGSSIEITGEVLQCLRPNAWLNDEVINLYLELLKEREKREPKRFLKCHFFNTFFYKKLISGKGGYDFKAVKRWTTQRKLGYGLVECEKIFIPIHKEIHWCLAIINKKDQKFQYLDSLKGRDSRVLNILARYYVDEVMDKSGKDIDISSWKQEYVDDLPAQENGFDCGMFMIKYADFYSRGLGLCFTQENMPYFRMRTVKEILRLKAE